MKNLTVLVLFLFISMCIFSCAKDEDESFRPRYYEAACSVEVNGENVSGKECNLGMGSCRKKKGCSPVQ